MTAPTQTVFGGGFQDAPIDAARAFRVAMNVMARPGEIGTMSGIAPPAPLGLAAAALLLTLCDPDTSVYLAGPLDTDTVRNWLSFHTGTPFAGPEAADFAVGAWADLMPLDQYRIGTPEYPDRSATLIVEMVNLDDLDDRGAVLRGPGIRTSTALALPDIAAMQANAMLYPQGCDFFLTCGDRLAALPRSTQISEG